MSDFPADKESQPASARGASIPPSSLFLNLLTLEPHQADTGSTTFNSSAHREESHRGSIVQPNPTTHTHTLSLSLSVQSRKKLNTVFNFTRSLTLDSFSFLFPLPFSILLVTLSRRWLAGWLSGCLFCCPSVSQPSLCFFPRPRNPSTPTPAPQFDAPGRRARRGHRGASKRRVVLCRVVPPVAALLCYGVFTFRRASVCC
ncbi:hypothetical protein BKA81DRAFT_126951 [Phyllosticta paracitricarpa]|uniref:Transmembrane protein n=1 Tax=Phyllosticta paracitricarpa TaxID=2016321 RepID=A0ABR1N3C6_9PEZI